MKQEKVWVVDENDNPIKIVNREDLKAGDIWRVSMVIVVDKNNKVLIAQRDFSKKYEAGKWGPSASGTIESHETPEQNVQKELKDELGIKLDINQFELKDKTFFKAEFGTGRISYMFISRVDFDEDDIKLTLEEGQVANAKWVDIEELAQDVKLNPEYYIKDMPSLLDLASR